MPEFTAQDVKRLRDETGAPMMECKNALTEAEGDFDKAKQLLRERGKAAAAKRAGRNTSAGVVAFKSSPDGKVVGGVVLESETDFVSNTPEFGVFADAIASIYLDVDPGADPLVAAKDGKSAGELVEEAIAKFRENIRVAKAIRLAGAGKVETYVHHDRTKGAAVAVSGTGGEPVRQVAIQIVSLPPDVVDRGQLSQEMLDRELETETQRSVNDGKPPEVARKIAEGRVNKEFVKRAALLEQPYYRDPGKTVGQFLKESGDPKIDGFAYLAVGAE